MIKKKVLAMNRVIYSLAIVLTTTFQFAVAQPVFNTSCQLDTVWQSGFFQIPLSAELTAACRPDKADIRIQDEKSKFIPYILTLSPVASKAIAATEMKIISKETSGKFTYITFQRPAEQTIGLISGFNLLLRNTMVERKAALSGSMDGEQWFAIKENIWLQSTTGSASGRHNLGIAIEPTDYTYFRLKISNGNADPLDIVGINTPNQVVTAPAAITNGNTGRIIFNPEPNFKQRDSSKFSIVTINNPAPFFTEWIDITVKGPVFYNRKLWVYASASIQDSEYLNTPVAEGEVTSGKFCRIALQGLKARQIVVRIANEDNPPLSVINVRTIQKQQYLIAWLDVNKDYKIVAGNNTVTAPNYDLARFRDSLPKEMPTLSTGPVSVNTAVVAVIPKKTKGNWIWPIIIISVAILSSLTYALVKDASKKL